MKTNESWTLKELILAVGAVFSMLFVQGAVPFLMMPTLGQAIWAVGFSQSFTHGTFFDFYVHDFGIPKPAVIPFGLAGVWPAGLLIRLGLHAADAYTMTAAAWLSLAMFSAYQISRQCGATRTVSLMGAVAWMSMPIIWMHAGYSMLSWAIALLSFYFMAAIRLFFTEQSLTRIPIRIAVLYFSASLVSIFMDGYTFMMFATGSTILLLYALITRPGSRRGLTWVAVPVHVISFGVAYIFYSLYIGKLDFESQDIDHFRGWGLDLSFLVIPTKGVLWLPDLLGFSLRRTNEIYYGDSSVWRTTFALPVLLLGIVAWWRVRSTVKISTGILLVAMFGFYMALGPSLKIDSTKPELIQINHPRQQSEMMPPEYAIMPTGNAWISESLPGFSVMRASYRWAALGIFALWLLVMFGTSQASKESKRNWVLGLFILIIFNLPYFEKKYQNSVDNREMLRQIDQELVADLRQKIQPNEKVAFIPWGNDFFANYLAPNAGFLTFNIGGDKNLNAAQASWPSAMLALGEKIDPNKAITATGMLVDGTADVLVLPYFNMLWSAHLWPCVAQTTARLSDKDKKDIFNIPGFVCPAQRKAELEPVVHALRGVPYVDVLDSPLFAIVRLRTEYSGKENKDALLKVIWQNISYPIEIGSDSNVTSFVLMEGWNAPEPHHTWSRSTAKLMLPVPQTCDAGKCNAVLHFEVFGASEKRPVPVFLSTFGQGDQWSEKIIANSGGGMQIQIPLKAQRNGRQVIVISVPDAISPSVLGVSLDSRILGVSLSEVDISSQ